MMNPILSITDPEIMDVPYQQMGQRQTLFYCPKCLRGFTLKSNRNRHFKYECGHEPRFKCPYCDLRSKQTSQIYSHVRRKHPGYYHQDPVLSRPYSELQKSVRGRRSLVHEKRFFCPRCSVGFTMLKNFKRHYDFECGHEPRYKCPYCDLRSKQTSQIYVHVRRRHPGEQVYYLDINGQ